MVLLVGLAAGLIGARAEASCGHYVKRLGAGFVAGRLENASSPAKPHSGALPARRCTGPQCQGLPIAPLSPPVPSVPRAPTEQLAIASPANTVCPSVTIWYPRAVERLLLSAGFPLLPDRPPNG